MKDPCLEVAKEDVEGTLPEHFIRGQAEQTVNVGPRKENVYS